MRSKGFFKRLTIVFAAVFAVYANGGSEVSGQLKPSLKDLAFMAGCWEIKVPGRKLVISEQWMAPMGDAMLGMNRTVTDGNMTGFEFLRIIEKGGTLYYIAMPSENDSPTSFELKTISKKQVLFENLGNDFPQTITYTLTGSRSMTAAVEGLANERPKRRRMDFPMLRTRCS